MGIKNCNKVLYTAVTFLCSTKISNPGVPSELKVKFLVALIIRLLRTPLHVSLLRIVHRLLDNS